MASSFGNRRSVRLQNFDYGATGAYFITICTHDHAPLFGEISGGIMCLNSLGACVWEEWCVTFEKRPDFSPGAFVVMPNHWHGIVHIKRSPENDWNAARVEAFGGSKKDTLATMVKGMKAAVTSFAKHSLGFRSDLWQRGFHDYVIRDAAEYGKIDAYILNNPRAWRNDCFYT